jgi:hypothetical protein
MGNSNSLSPYTQIQGLSPTFNFATKMQIALYFNFSHDNTSLIIDPYAQKIKFQ